MLQMLKFHKQLSHLFKHRLRLGGESHSILSDSDCLMPFMRELLIFLAKRHSMHLMLHCNNQLFDLHILHHLHRVQLAIFT